MISELMNEWIIISLTFPSKIKSHTWMIQWLNFLPCASNSPFIRINWTLISGKYSDFWITFYIVLWNVAHPTLISPHGTAWLQTLQPCVGTSALYSCWRKDITRRLPCCQTCQCGIWLVQYVRTGLRPMWAESSGELQRPAYVHRERWCWVLLWTQ